MATLYEAPSANVTGFSGILSVRGSKGSSSCAARSLLVVCDHSTRHIKDIFRSQITAHTFHRSPLLSQKVDGISTFTKENKSEFISTASTFCYLPILQFTTSHELWTKDNKHKQKRNRLSSVSVWMQTSCLPLWVENAAEWTLSEENDSPQLEAKHSAL